MDSPRGRIYLMKAHDEGVIQLSDVVKHFDRCLGCLACVTACPSGVKYDQLIEQTRVELEKTARRSLTERLLRSFIFGIFPYPRRLRALARLQWLYELSGLRALLRRLGLFRLLPRRLGALEALAPGVTSASLRASLPELTRPAFAPRRRVVLLPGCVQGVYFPEVNQATLRVLVAEGCEVVVPRGLGCCGALSLHAGRQAESQRLARRAIERLEEPSCDAIVVNSAGCGSAMKHWARLFADEPAWQARAAALAAKVKDVNELCSELAPLAARHPLALRVAYHDACHLSHGQGLRREPRALLRAIPGIELVDIPDAEQCCGSAGVYNLLEPASAEQIGRRKADHIMALKPDVLASANPGCTVQIKSQLGAAGASIRTLHPIELLDASIRNVRL